MHARRFLYATLLLLCCATAASADIKIKSRSSFAGQAGPETTTYIKGKRQRSEMPGGIATVTMCDLSRTVMMNGSTRTYTVTPFDSGPTPAATRAAAAATTPAPAERGGVITTTMTVTDTGERKQMFGYTARRLKTSMVTESSPDSCTPMKSRMESDGWYIDFSVGFDCYDKGAASYSSTNRQGCRDTYRMKQVGTARAGYPVHVTTTMFDETGRQTTSFTHEVIEISKAVLDAALFEVPAGYREVKDATQLYTGAPADDGGADADAGMNDEGAAADNDAAARQSAGAPAAGAAPRRDEEVAPKAAPSKPSSLKRRVVRGLGF